MTLCRLLYVVMYSHDVKSSCLLPVLWVVKYSHDVRCSRCRFLCVVVYSQDVRCSRCRFLCVVMPVFVCCDVQSLCEVCSLSVFQNLLREWGAEYIKRLREAATNATK